MNILDISDIMAHVYESTMVVWDMLGPLDQDMLNFGNHSIYTVPVFGCPPGLFYKFIR